MYMMNGPIPAFHTGEREDGFCPMCHKLVPIETFGNGVSDNTPNMLCTPCLDRKHASRTKSDSPSMIRKAYVDRRRLELIKENGCDHGGCVVNTIIDKLTDQLS